MVCAHAYMLSTLDISEPFILMHVSVARTPMNFLNCYLNLGIISNNDVYCYDASHNFVYDNRYSLDTAIYGSVPDILTFHLLPRYIYVLSNVSLTEIELKKYLANDIACAVIYISRRNLHLTPVWTEDLMLMTGCEHPSTVSHVIAVMDRLSSKALEAHFQKETLPVLLPRDEELSVNDTVSFDESDCEVTANSGSGLFDDSEHRCNIPAGHEQSMEQFTQYLNELAISGQEGVDVTAPVPPQSYARVKNTETKIDMSVIPSSVEKSRGVKPKSDIISPQSIAISSPMIGIVNGRQKTGADMTASIQKNIEKADAIRASIERLVS